MCNHRLSQQMCIERKWLPFCWRHCWNNFLYENHYILLENSVKSVIINNNHHWFRQRLCVVQAKNHYPNNKANLRDLISATGLIILLKLNSNRRFFSQCDLEIWWMTSKNNRAPLLYYVKLCASFEIHRWIKPGVTVRKPTIGVKIGDFFVPCDLDIWHMTLKNNRAPLLYYVKLCASFQSHR